MALKVMDNESAMVFNALSEGFDLSIYDDPIADWPWSVPPGALLVEDTWHVYHLSPGNAYQCDDWGSEDEISAF